MKPNDVDKHAFVLTKWWAIKSEFNLYIWESASNAADVDVDVDVNDGILSTFINRIESKNKLPISYVTHTWVCVKIKTLNRHLDNSYSSRSVRIKWNVIVHCACNIEFHGITLNLLRMKLTIKFQQNISLIKWRKWLNG